MKTPITYYGGKQRLSRIIVGLIPAHKLDCEPFCGGAAVFFAKQPSEIEVINDTNRELVNFYRVAQNDFVGLEREVRISLHSRSLHRDAKAIYENPHLFGETKRAWALWVLASQSFGKILGAAWGIRQERQHCGLRDGFTESYSTRLQKVQIECTDAIKVIDSRDSRDAFFYCDPPYFNADMGHYDGYTVEDFERLLKALSEVQGKFMLSSYPSPILDKYTEANGWHTRKFRQKVTVTNGHGKGGKMKIEVITANYPI